MPTEILILNLGISILGSLIAALILKWLERHEKP